MSKYELNVVIDAKATAAKKKAITEKVTKLVELVKGKVGKVEDFGEKKYGIVLMFPLELDPGAAKGVLTKVRQDEEVIKQLMIKI